MKSRTAGGCSTGGRRSTSASAYSACSRAVAAAGEERLQRLRGELDHAVALDAPRPAALERELLRREHAELHAANLDEGPARGGPFDDDERLGRCYAVAMSPRSTVFSAPVEPAWPAVEPDVVLERRVLRHDTRRGTCTSGRGVARRRRRRAEERGNERRAVTDSGAQVAFGLNVPPVTCARQEAAEAGPVMPAVTTVPWCGFVARWRRGSAGRADGRERCRGRMRSSV